MNSAAVVGSISPAGTAFPVVVADWKQWLADKGRKPKTIQQYAEVIEAMRRDLALADVQECRGADAEEWMLSKVRAGLWTGATHDHAGSVVRNFGAFLERRGHVPANPFARIESNGAQGGEGSRALTLDEARAIVLAAWETQQNTPRTRGERWAVWAWMMTTGLRAGEVAAIRWSSVDVAGGVLVTDPKWDKSGRRNVVPLSPDALVILGHLRRRYPHGAGDKLFPIQPNRLTWHDDRKRAGVLEADHRDRRATVHSCRKTYATLLDAVGATPGERNALMRHRDGVAGRYSDPEISRLRGVLSRLPSVLPPGVKIFSQSGWNPVESPPGVVDTTGAKDVHQPNQPGYNAPPEVSGGHPSQDGPTGCGRGVAVGFDERREELGDSARQSALAVGDRARIAQVLTDAGRLLKSVAELLAPKGVEDGTGTRAG